MSSTPASDPKSTSNQSVIRIHFNRPPRTCPIIPDKTVILPKPPAALGQGRGSAILSSVLISGTMIGASYFVSQTLGTSPIFLIVTAATSLAFLIVSIGQWVADRWKQWREWREYRRSLQSAIVDLIRLYVYEQYAYQYLYPVLTKKQAESNAKTLREELDELVTFLPRSITQRLLRRYDSPRNLELELPPTHQEDKAPFLLDIAGYDINSFKDPQPRLWERRPGDADMLALRLGTTVRRASFSVDFRGQLEQDEALSRICDRFLTVKNLPFTVSLSEVGSLGIAGSAETSTKLVHSIIWQIITLHSPSEVRVVALYDPDQHRDNWKSLLRAPHFIPLNGDRMRRMFPETKDDIERSFRVLIDELGQRTERSNDKSIPLPILVVVVDNDKSIQQHPVLKELLYRGKDCGIYLIVICGSWKDVPGECKAVVQIDNEKEARFAIAGNDWTGSFSPLLADTKLSDRLSQALIRIELKEMGGDRAIPRSERLYRLLRERIKDLDFARQWNQPIADSWHPDVPIGVGEGGKPVYLNLNDQKDGPHGIVAGKTGAGKSELLQAIITAVAATHGPERAEFLLIDFKGGAALRVFADLPHTVGFITDLQDKRLAERAITAMRSELRRRKDLFRKAGKRVQNINDYRSQSGVSPLANLLIVIDEFDTMVKEQPGFVDELITVVKQGRTLGMHLLVATQQPSVAVKDEIKGQLNYWLALRLGSIADSREMLQRPDAFFLPPDLPGRVYKRVGTSLELFQAARVSAPFLEDASGPGIAGLHSWVSISTQQTNSVSNRRSDQDRDIDVLVQKIKQAGKSHQRRSIWSPPLPARLTMSQVLPGGLQVLPSKMVSNLQQLLRGDKIESSVDSDQVLSAIPVGLVDIPQESRQEILHLDLQSGHLLVFGAPGSGKTLLLQTILSSIGAMVSPSRAWCYIIGTSGRDFAAFVGIPHAGSFVSVRDLEKVRRLLLMIKQKLTERESYQEDYTYFSDNRRWPDIVLIIDKFALFQTEYKETELVEDLIDIATRGRSYGIHVIVTADRPLDVPYRLQGLFEHRWCLRLIDESDSVSIMGRKDAARVPNEVPGRGYVSHPEHGWLEFQIALPYVQEDTVEVENILNAEISTRIRDFVRVIQQYWQVQGERFSEPPRIEPLPEKILFDDFWSKVKSLEIVDLPNSKCSIEVFFGLDAQSLEPVSFTLSAASPAIFVGGGPGSGKTVALRTIIRSIAQRYAQTDLDIILIDPRRTSFRDLAIPKPYRYAITLDQVAAVAQYIDKYIDDSKSNPLILCIDDYDVAQEQMSDQFKKPYSASSVILYTAIEKALNLGREKGFFIIVAAKGFSHLTGLLGQISDLRQGLILQPHNFPAASELLGVRLPIPLAGRREIAGRGLKVFNNSRLEVQVAYFDLTTKNERTYV